MGERVQALASQIEGAAAEKLQRETENEQLAQQAPISKPSAMLRRLARDSCNSKLNNFAPVSPRSMNSCATAAQLLDQARDRRGELSAAAAKLQSDGQYMSETCLNELGVERAGLTG